MASKTDASVLSNNKATFKGHQTVLLLEHMPIAKTKKELNCPPKSYCVKNESGGKTKLMRSVVSFFKLFGNRLHRGYKMYKQAEMALFI